MWKNNKQAIMEVLIRFGKKRINEGTNFTILKNGEVTDTIF